MSGATHPRSLRPVFLTGAVDFLAPESGNRRFWPVAVKPTRFRVSASRADGHTVEYTAIGGNSCDHTIAAMDLAGLGGVVRVVALAEADAA